MKGLLDKLPLDARHDLVQRIMRPGAEIDALLYELYGLTQEEIGVVGGN